MENKLMNLTKTTLLVQTKTVVSYGHQNAERTTIMLPLLGDAAKLSTGYRC